MVQFWFPPRLYSFKKKFPQSTVYLLQQQLKEAKERIKELEGTEEQQRIIQSIADDNQPMSEEEAREDKAEESLPVKKKPCVEVKETTVPTESEAPAPEQVIAEDEPEVEAEKATTAVAKQEQDDEEEEEEEELGEEEEAAEEKTTATRGRRAAAAASSPKAAPTTPTRRTRGQKREPPSPKGRASSSSPAGGRPKRRRAPPQRFSNADENEEAEEEEATENK